MSNSLYSGRIGRFAFARNIAVLAIAISVVVAVVPILQRSESDLAGFAIMILVLITVYGGFVYSLHNVVRRLHDIDLSGWLALTFYIPPVGILLLVALLVVPGSPGINRFGESDAVEADAMKFRFNPYFCKTEGWRRLSIAASSVGLLAWALYVTVESDGFSKGFRSQLELFTVVLGFPLAIYLLILALRGMLAWIAKGFRSE